MCVCAHAGMSAGLPKFVTVNLSDLEKAFEAGATVDLQAVQDKKLLNVSGRDTKLPLKVRPPAVVLACVLAVPHREWGTGCSEACGQQAGGLGAAKPLQTVP